jgi:predicted transcriptional regulator of viral defense system
MNPYEAEISQIIQKDNGYLLISSIEKHGIFRKYAYMYLSERPEIKKLGRGIYCTPSTIPDMMFVVTKRNKKAILSHQSALYLNDLITSKPIKIAVTVPKEYMRGHLKANDYDVYRSTEKLFPIGRMDTTSKLGNPVVCYDRERTVLDIIRELQWKHHFEDEIAASKAIRKYFQNEDLRNLPKLYEYAEKFHCKNMVQICANILL